MVTLVTVSPDSELHGHGNLKFKFLIYIASYFVQDPPLYYPVYPDWSCVENTSDCGNIGYIISVANWPQPKVAVTPSQASTISYHDDKVRNRKVVEIRTIEIYKFIPSSSPC